MAISTSKKPKVAQIKFQKIQKNPLQKNENKNKLENFHF
jgi:hypothetical protein